MNDLLSLFCLPYGHFSVYLQISFFRRAKRTKPVFLGQQRILQPIFWCKCIVQKRILSGTMRIFVYVNLLLTKFTMVKSHWIAGFT